jgi:hypothetical protein
VGVGGESTVKCPNNVCFGLGKNSNGDTFYVQFMAFAVGASGYFNPVDIAQGVWEWNGRLLTGQGYYNEVIKPYEDRMKAKIAAALGIPVEDLTVKGVKGGNTNFYMSASGLIR